jgi:SpoVK/Ycf46/Vps4 family AAA+-type ATPase
LAGLVSRAQDISFENLYGIKEIIERLQYLVVKPFNEIGKYQDCGISPPKGLLIYGGSGCGKTALASALVKETGLSCVFVSAPSIRSKVVGESEQTIARLFAQARSSAPCILLMDQLESIVTKRGHSSSSQGSGDRIITTFLTEMDGIFTDSNRLNVFIVASNCILPSHIQYRCY